MVQQHLLTFQDLRTVCLLLPTQPVTCCNPGLCPLLSCYLGQWTNAAACSMVTTSPLSLQSWCVVRRRGRTEISAPMWSLHHQCAWDFQRGELGKHTHVEKSSMWWDYAPGMWRIGEKHLTLPAYVWKLTAFLMQTFREWLWGELEGLLWLSQWFIWPMLFDGICGGLAFV